MAHHRSGSAPMVVYTRTQSMSPPRLPEQRAQSMSPPRMSEQRAQSQSPPRMGSLRKQSKSPPRVREQRTGSAPMVVYTRTQSMSPPRLPEQRAQSMSPPRMSEQRAQSQSPPRMGSLRKQSKSPPRVREQRTESKSPPRLAEEDGAQSTSPPRSRSRGHHRPRDSSDPQSAGSEKTQNSGRTRGKHRRATPTPSQRPEPADSDLHAACWTGNMAAVKRMLSQGQSDIGGRGGLLRMTPVMTAAYEGQVDVVKIMVSEGADVSLVDEYGDNILHFACVGGDVETVKFMLSLHVVDNNSRGGGSLTPVMKAAWNGQRDVVELLVSEGADVSLVDEVGDNILHWACIGGDVETVKFMLSLNVADINSRGRWSRTPVMEAAWNGQRDVVELLVSEGADVSLVDEVGNNILYYACLGGHVETVKFVLSLNVVDIDARNNAGQTAADVARRAGHEEVVKLL
ncbi:inversin-like isoform X2 [Haliotis rufescens]|uniref:inversin-like isoform X2 n=1 Tax=Haliotis rufescens TaxID=6454 RepID=UPI00201F8D90|nr:inversin-like isoform X2 [Haliotis rufescens]XP_048249031.1 inversin-like isoform X2 [Haliotis rufescens]